MRRQRYYVALNPSEVRLATQAMLAFRNKIIEHGVDTIDVDRILLKLYGKSFFMQIKDDTKSSCNTYGSCV